MQSPWQTDFRDRKADLDFLRSERSTSAPPPETSLLFGTRNDGRTTGRVDVSLFIYFVCLFVCLCTIIDRLFIICMISHRLQIICYVIPSCYVIL